MTTSYTATFTLPQSPADVGDVAIQEAPGLHRAALRVAQAHPGAWIAWHAAAGDHGVPEGRSPGRFEGNQQMRTARSIEWLK